MFVRSYSDAPESSVVRVQDIALVMEAAIYERARALQNEQSEEPLAVRLADKLATAWPAGLSSIEQASACAVSLTHTAFRGRLERLRRCKSSEANLPRAAVRVLARSSDC